MGILRQRNWNNSATTDLTDIDKLITTKKSEIAAFKTKIINANTNIKKCADHGRLYNCKRNTGKSMNVWVDYRNSWRSSVGKLEKEIVELESERVYAVESIRKEAIARGQSAEAAEKTANAASAESKAKASKAGVVGVWVGVGLLGLAGLVFIWSKIKK